MKRMTRSLAIALLCLFAFGCSMNEEYVKADQATFDAIAPEYLKYVGVDQALSQEQRDRRVRTVSTWRLRIDKAREE